MKRYQPITDAVMYLMQVSRSDIMFGVNYLARALSKPSKTDIAVANLHYIEAGMVQACDLR